MMYRAMMDHPDIRHRATVHLRRAVYAMAPMPDARTCCRAMDVFGCDFALLFGQTEMSPITTLFPPEHQLAHAGRSARRSPNVQVGIMDDEGATCCPAGRSGEIVYRGPHAMTEYLRDDGGDGRRRSRTAGSTPATSGASTTTGCSGSPTATRT